MHDAGIAVVVANPRQVRDFAKGHGFLEKNDKIDAAVIRKFGEDVFVHPAIPPTPAVARKLLLILNQMARPEGQMWDANYTSQKDCGNKKESSCAPSLN